MTILKPALLTMGDPNGIGPEIIFKSFIKNFQFPLVAIGHFPTLEFHFQKLIAQGLQFDFVLRKISYEALQSTSFLFKDNLSKVLHVYDPFDGSDSYRVEFGFISSEAGRLAIRCIEVGASLCKAGIGSALITAPIHKEALVLSGSKFKGHTDFLGEYFRSDSEMILCDRASGLKVALATVHVPIKDVATVLRNGAFKNSLTTLLLFLKQRFRIEKPKVAILGLNPHASDNGVIGDDEISYLKTILEEERLKNKDALIEGFFPADGFFGSAQYKNFDCVLALYHDSGLIPFKMLAFETGVNVTMGLPIIRTSPDHGTAFDIAGKGIASSKSFEEAIKLALELQQIQIKNSER